jgi:spore photoproduct lyase
MEKKMGVRNVVSQHIDAASPKAGDGRARYPRGLQRAVYSLIIERVRRLRPDLELALCLEEKALWESTGLVASIGRCNCRL